MNLRALPAFNDNYIWTVDHLGHAIVVDPGDASVVQTALTQHGLVLDAILVTHHHPDHTGGVAQLRDSTGATVFGPGAEAIPQPFEPVMEGVELQLLGLNWRVLDVPGHTAGHIAFFAPDFDGAPLVFCGDTLFSAGCGRIFEGTPAQLHDSLQKLALLPANTRVCCTHEYTLSNLRFAMAVEPDNQSIRDHAQHCQRLREQNRMTLPSTMALESEINPFLRTHVSAVRQAARLREPGAETPVEIFAALRKWKNVF
ncbi:MAG: hydroxyacylglutathione hydrolase [Pseudomonadota bacterium]|jgi:hydroxyacylglutathione hydrolase